MSSPSALTTAAAPGEHRAAENREADAPQGAGWYESSWELVSGLEVSEVLECDPDVWPRLGNDALLSERASPSGMRFG